LTVPVAIVLFVMVTALMPLFAVLALIVDLVRWVRHKIPFVAIRVTAASWVYLAVEMFGLAVLLAIWLVTGFGTARQLSLKLTYRLQAWWAAALFGSLRALFGMELRVEGDEVVVPGPIIVMMRHASMADTLMPNLLITRRHGIFLRYVLKRELLIDPALDIAGNRLVNYFVDRRSADGDTEVMHVHALTRGLREDEGVIIYPEGTRFSGARRQRIIERLESGADDLADRARRLHHLLPPRLGGSLAVLDSLTPADVVFVAHVGLDGLARVKDLWGGGLVGAVVEVGLWRVPQDEIPDGESERIDWLFEQWGRVDDWIAERVG
jgi:1-acyl-sn-glycerol-3-phosphate acyltransferase